MRTRRVHARELVDLAAFVSAEGPVLFTSALPLSADVLGEYWSASKCRVQRWQAALRNFRDLHPARPFEVDAAWQSIRPVCEEIIATEMLTRVWSNLITGLDSKTAANDAQPVAVSVLTGHIDAATRVLELSNHDRFPARGTEELNRFRRLCERWTDLMLGFLGAPGDIGRFAHDPARAGEFSVDMPGPDRPAARRQAWGLLSASLRGAFGHRWHGETANSDLNSRIAGSILACFPGELFDSSGAYHSLWMLRLSAAATDTQALVDELLSTESQSDETLTRPSFFNRKTSGS